MLQVHADTQRSKSFLFPSKSLSDETLIQSKCFERIELQQFLTNASLVLQQIIRKNHLHC